MNCTVVCIYVRVYTCVWWWFVTLRFHN